MSSTRAEISCGPKGEQLARFRFSVQGDGRGARGAWPPAEAHHSLPEADLRSPRRPHGPPDDVPGANCVPGLRAPQRPPRLRRARARRRRCEVAGRQWRRGFRRRLAAAAVGVRRRRDRVPDDSPEPKARIGLGSPAPRPAGSRSRRPWCSQVAGTPRSEAHRWADARALRPGEEHRARCAAVRRGVRPPPARVRLREGRIPGGPDLPGAGRARGRRGERGRACRHPIRR